MKNIDSNERMRVLIVKISSMGDVIHTFPVVRAIKKSFPDSIVDWVAASGYSDLVRLSPYVDTVFPFMRNEWSQWWSPATLKQLARFAGSIRASEYNAVLDLQGLLRSGLISFAARSPLKIGFAYAREGASFFYNRKVVSTNADAHAIDRYMLAAAELGVDNDAEIKYDLEIPQKELERAQGIVPGGAFVAINPNARWETKRWPVERFAALAKELYRREGLLSVIVGGPDDMERGKAVKDEAGDCATDLTGSGGLASLAAILKKSTGLFTNDSGPMHLAVALGTPTVSIFGPTSVKRTGPYGMERSVVRSDVQCAPCYRRVCPTDHECMDSVNVDNVLSAWDKIKKGAG